MRGQLRILFLVNALDDDAPTAMTIAVAREAARQGAAVLLVVWKRGRRGETKADGIEAVVLGGSMISSALRLSNLISVFKPTVVHTALARPTLGLALARAQGMRKTFAWVAADHGVHEWDERGRLIGWLMRTVMPSVLHQSDTVVTVSEAAARELRLRGVERENIKVIGNGVDMRRFYPRSTAERAGFIFTHFGDGDHKAIFLIGSAGNLREIKGHEVLVRSMATVAETVPGARLVLFGQGPEETKLKGLVKHLKLERRVAFVGYEGELEKRLPLLNLYVQPSHVESFGLAAAEAMACGVPTVVSTAGGLPEVAGKDGGAMLFERGNIQALAETILLVEKDARLRRKLGVSGRLRVLKCFTQQGMVNNYMAHYRHLDESHYG